MNNKDETPIRTTESADAVEDRPRQGEDLSSPPAGVGVYERPNRPRVFSSTMMVIAFILLMIALAAIVMAVFLL